MRPVHLIAALCLIPAVAGCARFPEVYAATSLEAQRAPTPVLADVDDVLPNESDALLDETTQAGMEARADALQARAEAAMKAGIPPEEVADLLARAAALRAEAARVAQGG